MAWNISKIFNIFPSKHVREKNVKTIDIIANKALEAIENFPEFKVLSKNEQKVVKNSTFSEDVKENFISNKKNGFEHSKNIKEICFHFFGMNDNWPIWRNLLGGLMVHAPEYPTYFIPAYTQAKATGNADDLKKGEGPRGLITGGLEGLAVGALVSGRFLKAKEMLPYVLLGMGLQFFSSKVFPWIGEKAGCYAYRNNLQQKFENLIPGLDNIQQPEQEVTLQNIAINKYSQKPYSPYSAGNLKI